MYVYVSYAFIIQYGCALCQIFSPCGVVEDIYIVRDEMKLSRGVSIVPLFDSSLMYWSLILKGHVLNMVFVKFMQDVDLLNFLIKIWHWQQSKHLMVPTL